MKSSYPNKIVRVSENVYHSAPHAVCRECGKPVTGDVHHDTFAGINSLCGICWDKLNRK